MNTASIHSHDIVVSISSPVHIGTNSADALSPYSDFIEERGKVYVLDHNIIQKNLEQKPQARELIDEYVREIKKGMRENTATPTSLKFFVQNKLRIENLKEISTHVVDLNGEVKHQKILPTITNARKPYIPGTTLKGAIRTALLYDWLCNATEGKAFVEDIKNILNSSIDDSKKKKDLKSLKEQVQCFGTIEHDQLQYLQVTDTNVVEANTLRLLQTQSAVSLKRLDTENRGTPEWKLCLGERTTLSCRITLRSKFHGFFSYLNGKYGIDELLKRVHIFNQENLKREKKRFDTLPDFDRRKLQKLVQFYDKIEHLNDHHVLMRLGKGKTFFDNSIGLALPANMLARYIELFELHLPPRRSQQRTSKQPFVADMFPSTRTFIYENNQVVGSLGWITLCKKEHHIEPETTISHENKTVQHQLQEAQGMPAELPADGKCIAVVVENSSAGVFIELEVESHQGKRYKFNFKSPVAGGVKPQDLPLGFRFVTVFKSADSIAYRGPAR